MYIKALKSSPVENVDWTVFLREVLFRDAMYLHFSQKEGIIFNSYQQMNGMPLREMDKIIYPVCKLCRDHEKAGLLRESRLEFSWQVNLNSKRRRCIVHRRSVSLFDITHLLKEGGSVGNAHHLYIRRCIAYYINHSVQYRLDIMALRKKYHKQSSC